MPIFDNEIKDKGTKLSNIELPDVDKRSPTPTQINPNLGMEDLFGSNQTPTYNGVKWGEMTNVGEQRGFDRPFSGVTKATLLENQRYPMYQKDVDLENIYGLQQSWYKQLANGLTKGGITAVGTFAQGLMTIPDTINSIKTGKVSELSGGTDDIEAHVDNWIKNMEDVFPNYYTRDEREHPFRAAIPFTSGFANFLGDKIIKNLGFTAGAIGSAMAQDAVIGFVTGGLGELPLIGAQIGKASLYLNKLFTGTNDLDKVLNLAKGLGKTEKQLLNIERLGQLAASRKIGSGLEYVVALYGSSRTEAAVESRDGYNQVKTELIRQHKLKNLGEDPTPKNLAEIDQYATNAMNVRFGINMALLTISNAIQFDSIFKSFTKAGSKGLTSGATRELEDLGKIGLKEGSLDVFEKKAATSIPGKVWEFVEPKIPNVLAEGVYEEGGQFAAEKGTYDYYTRKYKDPKKGENQATWNSLNEIIKSTGYGLHEQFGGEEGWENMFIGGLSAMLTGAGMSRIDRMKGGGKDARLQTAINSLNQYGMTGTLGASYDNTVNSINISKEMNEAANSGNVFKYKNLKHEAFFNFVNSRLASDRHDVTVEQLNMLKDLSKEEFEKTFGMDFNASNQKTVSGYVDGLINKANQIKKTSDSINDIFKNPFKQIINPKGEDEITETVKHTVFENWKTDLSYYSSVAPEVNDRLNSIEKSVSEIHESLNNDLLSSLTNPESIKDLSKSYEEQANQLSKTITEFTSLEDKKKTNAQIKALRTQAEKINLALNTNNYDLKTFNSLLNFELNNHDTSKSDAINMTDAPKLFGYGNDINKLEGLKTSASDTLDKLSSKDGFEKYFKQADDMAEEVLIPEEVVTPETKPIEAGIPQYITPSGKRENLDIGREYTIGKYTKSKVSKIADDRWQTVSPDGTFEIYPTKEKADEAAAELNDEFANLEKIKIVGHNADGTVKIEDKNGDIYDINTRKLSGFIKKESEQEKLQKFASALDKQQTEIEKKSGIVGTGNNETDLAAMPKEDMLKSADKLFISTTSTSEDWDNPTIKPHEVRSRELLNNVKNFSNRGNIKLILVTPNQEESLGLKGLGELSGSTDVSVSDGLVAAVYVAQVNGKTYFVDEKGKTIGEVGQPVDINKVVFSTMSKPKLTNSKGGNRFRRGEEAAALAQRNAWEVKRAQLLAAPAGSFTVYDFGVSRGIPIKNQVGGKNEKNAVGENLIPENKIETQGGLIVISTTGTLAHNGENFKVPKGRPMLQYGDTFQFLDNAVFNADQAKTIFEAIKVLSEDITKKAAEGKTIEFNRLYSDYIQKMLYWRKSSDTTNNQIYLDTTNMDLYLGGKKYAFTDIAGNEKAIIDQLKQTYHSVNNEAVKDLAEPFVELYFEDNYLKDREWVNYQTYLLSSTYPNGKKRSDSDVPLTTSVAKPTAAMPYNYKQKYATLQGMELPIQAVAPVVVVAAPAAPTAASVKKIGEYTIDGKTENKIALKDPLGETSFTVSVDAEGKVTAEVTLSPAQQAVASDPTKVAPYINALKQGGKYDSTDSDEKSLAKFMAINVAAKLEAIEKAEAPVAPVVSVAPITTDLYKKSAINTFPISRLGFIPRAVAEKAYAEYSKRYGKNQSLDALATRGGFSVLEMDDLYPGWRDEVAALNAPAAPVVSDKEAKTEQEVINKINARYNEELATLESGKPKDFSKTTPPDEAEYRRVGGVNGSRITDAEIQLFKEYVAKNVPGIPYEILEQIITTHDGEKAWGVFENGVAKFYKGAIKGTEYHELFEGIWKAFVSSEDQQVILDEFKAKKGTFTDRQSGRKIDYADATDRQAKERIADDFADFRVGKLPAKTIGEKILKFFRDIIQFVKEFVNKPFKKTELFKAIDSGKFKERTLNTSETKEFVNNNSFVEYRAVEGLTEQQTNEFVQDITARTFQIIFGNNLSLYDIEKMTAPEIFGQIKDKYDIEGKSELLGEQSWKDLIKKTKEFLRTFKVEFDDEQQVSINDENVNKNDYVPEGFTTDWKKTSPFPIKLLLGTLIETAPTNQENGSSFTLPKPKWSPLIVGFKLLNFSRAFATVLDKFANTSKVTEVVDKLIDLAKYDSNYVRLFTRLGGNRENAVITFSDFKKEDWRLFINFYQTFTKQKPDALIQYNKGSEVYTAPANLFTAIKEKQTGWVENMKELAKDKDSLIFKNKSTKTYQVKEEIKDVEINNPQNMVSFLNKLGIIFPMEVYSKLKPIQQNKFANSVGAIRLYLGKEQDLLTLTGDTLGINGQLSILAELLVKVTNPNQDPTYFNVENKRTNSFSENNAPSLFENAFASSETLDQLLEERPELTDLFSAHSVILKKGGLFYDKNGNKTKALKVSYIQGTNDIDDNKGITTSKLSKGYRYTQELNQNLNGNYYILIPADGSTEWMMNMGNHISFTDVFTDRAAAKVNEIFKGYLKDDIALALDAKNREKNRNLGDRGSELRFLKDILSEKMLNGINDLISKEASEEEFDDYINKNIGDFNKSVQDYINNYTNQSFNLLKEKKQISEIGKDKFSYGGLDDVFTKKQKLNKFKLSEQSARSIIKFADINYIINNVEYHKILFGDPLQFAIKEKNGKTILDETKRVKSFLSPRRTTFDTVEYNTFLNQTFNKVGEIELSPTDPGYHLHKAYANTVTFSDVDVFGSLASIIPAYAKTNEADAASFIMDGTYREVKLKNAQWDDNAEDWHQWQLAYTRLALEKKKVYAYTNDALRAADTKLISTPSPKYTIEILKPIVSGNKFGKSQFDLVLDKFSQMPIYYSMIEGHAFEKFYIKMFKENKDYAIMLSGRKVGAEELHDLYVDGEVNEAPFNNNIQVPWKAYGIQVENSYSGPKETTRGSQITKVSSMDLFENGIAVSLEVEQEYRHNVKMLDLLHENGYDSLLEKLGIRDLGTSFELVNKKAVSETLEYEMLRRELSDNAKDTVQLDKDGQFRIPFEASPAYVQIRDILYSMVDKSIRSPKMNGGGYVQAPVTLWESSKAGRKVVEVNGKKVLTDSSLKFYTKDEPWCEIMLPAWFKNKLNKNGRFKTDEDILNYLNKTEEGREILSGIGFRIPTQSLSSTEVFRVKGFLHESFGKTVVVPSEITVKAGSDFDIDKLNMYLKSIYIDKNGDIRLVRYKKSIAASNEFYGKVFDDKLEGRIAKKDELLEALQIYNYGLDDPKGLVDKYANTLDILISGLGDVNDTTEIEEGIIKELEKLGDKNFQEGLRIKFQKEMYKRSLENEYYASLGRLIAAPENFERLISPVDDAGLQKISEELDKLKGDDESKIKNRMLNRNFLTALRHAFVSGKRWVGIAAVNITGHSLTQKVDVHLDPSRFALVSENDQKFLGNGEMILTHNTTKINGQEYISLSGVTDGDGKQHISDSLSGAGTSIVDVSKDPFFMKIVSSDLAIGPFMFLIRVGVPLRQLSLFMNQPIVTEYFNYLDSEGSKTLYNDKKIKDILGKFPTTTAAYSAAKINLGQLGENIKEYSVDKKFNNDADNATQHLILDEFLKYAKMSDYSFKMTQATNYDTTSFRSGDALYKKQLRTQKALDTNIFAGIDALLNDTFIGKQADLIDGATEGIGEILKLDNAEFSEITNEVLTSYANNEYMSADNFDTIGNKLKASFLDYLIQTNSTLANQINKLLVNVGTSVATRLANAQKAHPEINILNDLSIVTSNREDGAKSIKLIANLKSAYDENLYTGMMRELRDTPGMRDFYNDIVKLAILQGTYQSSISIKNIIPIEDYSAIVKPIIDSIQPSGDTTAFVSTRSFQKNNWKDDKIVPTFLPKFFSDMDAVPIAEQLNSFGDHIADIYQYWAPAFPSIKTMGIKSSDRKVLLLSERYNSFNLKDDVIKVPRVVTDPYSGERVDMRNGQTITNFDYAIKKQKGDNTLNDFYGYAKVKLIDGSPLLHVDKKGGVHHVYKMINLLGDGRFASEYYTDNRMSILDNGTVKINEEIPNNLLIEYYGGEPVVSEQIDLAKEAQLKNFTTVESIKSKGTFRNKPIEFVDKIETTKNVSVAMQNNRTTGVIKIDEKLMQQKFDEKAWTNPATQLDNSKAEALPANTFKTFNEFLTFALIYEVKHDSILQNDTEKESKGDYETRINNAAIADLRENYKQSTLAADENNLEGAEDPNSCGQ